MRLATREANMRVAVREVERRVATCLRLGSASERWMSGEAMVEVAGEGKSQLATRDTKNRVAAREAERRLPTHLRLRVGSAFDWRIPV
jgi:hypothetical protein